MTYALKWIPEKEFPAKGMINNAYKSYASEIEITSSMVQLEVTHDSKLKFSEHINLLTTKYSNLVYVHRKIPRL